ncbi:hypothetical protein [Microbacterium sp. NPDC087592]|uniref:hypothetical protein n=1 Tax=Microbacterium sp. NPDC087592 TaxID=3364193 RepID=UPI0038019548
MKNMTLLALGAIFTIGVVAAAFADWTIFGAPLVLGTAALLILGGMSALAYADSDNASEVAARQWRGAGAGTLALGGIVALGCILSMNAPV